MFKLFVILFTLSLSLWGKAEEKKPLLEVHAQTIESTKNGINAYGGVEVFYDGSLIHAQRVTFDQKKQKLTFLGNIETLGPQGSKSLAKHLTIFTKTQEVVFKKLFLSTKDDMWIYTDKATKKGVHYALGQSVLSSCEVSNPLWKMTFASSEYDSNSSYLSLHHTKVYFLDTPIFYFPYLSFSTKSERSSGLLFPLMGSTQEGFVYEQPLFWAISPSMDLEIDPQIRFNRSLGAYGTFRFVDTARSSGTLRMGYFKDDSSYHTDSNESRHYGLEFLYEREDPFAYALPQGFHDGLYINMTLLNDIDYLNLQKQPLEHFSFMTPLQESKLNYFIEGESFYFGLNSQYFIDTRQESNENTVQILPSLQWHSYLQALGKSKLFYSVDMTVNHFYKEEGATLKEVAWRIPLSYHFSFFEDYLQLSVEESFYYSRYFFDHTTLEDDSLSYSSSVYKMKLFSDLVKSYTDYTHVIQPFVDYIKPGNAKERPVAFDTLSSDAQSLLVVNLPEEQYTFGLSQYLYDDTMKLRFFERFEQAFFPERQEQWGDMQNELSYYWSVWRLYNRLRYSHAYHTLRETSSWLEVEKPRYRLRLEHSYKKVLPDELDVTPSNDLGVDFLYHWSKKISLNGGLSVNLDNQSDRQWRIGGAYEEDCWQMVLSLKQTILPRPSGSSRDNSFYVQFNFVPFFSTGALE
jgi:LPS-assembly protein